MKIYYSPTSPYVRKCMVAAAETGQTLQIIPAAANPIKRDQTVVAVNPTGKVPTAILDDGSVLFDSRVICWWIDTQHDMQKLYPEGDALWPVLRQEAMADGLLDSALLVRYETAVRPSDKLWPEWLQGLTDKIESTLDVMEAESEGFGELSAGLIAIACSLGYLDFRLPDFSWRKNRPGLEKWYEKFALRPSMKTSAPA